MEKGEKEEKSDLKDFFRNFEKNENETENEEFRALDENQLNECLKSLQKNGKNNLFFFF